MKLNKRQIPMMLAHGAELPGSSEVPGDPYKHVKSG